MFLILDQVIVEDVATFFMRHSVVEAHLKLCIFERIKIAAKFYPVQTERSLTEHDILLYSQA